jgi:hypothetical protein
MRRKRLFAAALPLVLLLAGCRGVSVDVASPTAAEGSGVQRSGEPSQDEIDEQHLRDAMSFMMVDAVLLSRGVLKDAGRVQSIQQYLPHPDSRLDALLEAVVSAWESGDYMRAHALLDQEVDFPTHACEMEEMRRRPPPGNPCGAPEDAQARRPYFPSRA